MHKLILPVSGLVALIGIGCGGGRCDDACEKMAQCFDVSAKGGEESTWQCPLAEGICDMQKRCFARCNLEATCEEIRDPKKPSPYRTCREACAAKHFHQDAGAAGDAGAPADGEVPAGDLTGPYWQCAYQQEMLVSGCVFAWYCPSGDDRELTCQQDGSSHTCTCKNKNKGTTEATFSAEDICNELPAQEVTSRANKSCGWKIQQAGS